MGVMSVRTLALLLTSIGLGAGGQLMFKAAAKSLPPFAELGLFKLVLTMFTTPMILAGFACFFVSSLLWIVAIRNIPLSTAYPMVALSYIIIFTGSYFLFNEPLSWRHWVGALLIVGGIVLISWQR
jgi:undecaprenyl phosphate-alpha-L-ara4N flippase subunit ArnF